ncbi:MAG: tyrosine-type recombinase/integrase, partial [Culicoidibacterales bacterium]
FERMIKYFGNKKIQNITALEIQKWKNSLTTQYAQNYARAIFGLFTQTLEKATVLGIIPINRAKQTGTIKKAKITVDFWTKNEFEQVLTTFNLSDYYIHYSFVIVWLLFMTGLRVNEATALRWSYDIDFENKTLSVQHSLRIKTKTDWYLGPTKTRAGIRTIALDNDTIEILKSWKNRQLQATGLNVEFILSYDSLPTIKSTINRIITRHAELAGVHRIQPKGLRHSHASFLINEYNVNPLIIKDRLGHEDIKTTLSTYSHLYPNINFEIANQISGTISYETANITQTKFNGNQSVPNRLTNSKEESK